jgi:hypothetical protein
MGDLVVTCPAPFFPDWIAEGDAAGDPYTGEEWGWFTRIRPSIEPGERLYVVACGKLRGYAPVTRVAFSDHHGLWVICRRGGAMAMTIEQPIQGFRGLRRVWWSRDQEQPFPDWRTYGVKPTPRGLEFGR